MGSTVLDERREEWEGAVSLPRECLHTFTSPGTALPHLGTVYPCPSHLGTVYPCPSHLGTLYPVYLIWKLSAPAHFTQGAVSLSPQLGTASEVLLAQGLSQALPPIDSVSCTARGAHPQRSGYLELLVVW